MSYFFSYINNAHNFLKLGGLTRLVGRKLNRKRSLGCIGSDILDAAILGAKTDEAPELEEELSSY